MKIFYKIKFCFVKKWIDLSLLLKGIRIKKAETIEELDEVRHFAWEVYALQERYIDPNFFPKKMFDDEFDKYSTYFFATNKNKIIGIVRIV